MSRYIFGSVRIVRGRIANWLATILVSGFFSLACVHASTSIAGSNSYPRVMAMVIGEKDYASPQFIARVAATDVAILGFYRGWHGPHGENIGYVLEKLKAANPSLLIGQYTKSDEAYVVDNPRAADADIKQKIDSMGWWLLTANGEKLQLLAEYPNYREVNVTRWAAPDADGLRYPEWINRRDNREFFRPYPAFSIWYFDNIMAFPRNATADWKRDGRDIAPDAPEVQAAFRRAYEAQWYNAQQLEPHTLLMGNVDNDLSSPEYRGRLDGAFLEGQIGPTWSIESQQGWPAMMARYHAVFENTRAPHIVGFNVQGAPKDYHRMRYGLASCLMDDGYYAYTDINYGYVLPPMFDEYKVKLGAPLDQPQIKSWKRGIYRRRFENGIVLLNPWSRAVRVDIGPGYRHFAGQQDPTVNNGKAVRFVELGPKDGILLVRDGG